MIRILIKALQLIQAIFQKRRSQIIRPEHHRGLTYDEVQRIKKIRQRIKR